MPTCTATSLPHLPIGSPMTVLSGCVSAIPLPTASVLFEIPSVSVGRIPLPNNSARSLAFQIPFRLSGQIPTAQ